MRRRRGKGVIAVTFALGLMASCVFPPRVLVTILAIWVIVLGCSGPKC